MKSNGECGVSLVGLRLIQQHIWLNVGVRVAFALLALFGLTSMWLAILADVGMLLVVTLNGMRPIRYQSPASFDL